MVSRQGIFGCIFVAGVGLSFMLGCKPSLEELTETSALYRNYPELYSLPGNVFEQIEPSSDDSSEKVNPNVFVKHDAVESLSWWDNDRTITIALDENRRIASIQSDYNDVRRHHICLDIGGSYESYSTAIFSYYPSGDLMQVCIGATQKSILANGDTINARQDVVFDVSYEEDEKYVQIDTKHDFSVDKHAEIFEEYFSYDQYMLCQQAKWQSFNLDVLPELAFDIAGNRDDMFAFERQSFFTDLNLLVPILPSKSDRGINFFRPPTVDPFYVAYDDIYND